MRRQYYNEVLFADHHAVLTKKMVLREMHMFSDQEIMQLQDMLLTPGNHHLTAASVRDGRAVLLAFLESLNCYKNLSCITLSDKPYDESIQIISTWSKQDEIVETDFLWIEMTPLLCAQPWLYHLQEDLRTWHVDTYLPIIWMRYE